MILTVLGMIMPFSTIATVVGWGLTQKKARNLASDLATSRADTRRLTAENEALRVRVDRFSREAVEYERAAAAMRDDISIANEKNMQLQSRLTTYLVMIEAAKPKANDPQAWADWASESANKLQDLL